MAVLAIAALPALAGRALAGDPRPDPPASAPSAVARLRPEEVAAIRARIPDWDTLDEAQRERIAMLVLALRRFTPEQRDIALARLNKAARGGPGAIEDLAEKVKKYRELPQSKGERVVQFAQVARAVALVVVADLPPASQSLLRSE